MVRIHGGTRLRQKGNAWRLESTVPECPQYSPCKLACPGASAPELRAEERDAMRVEMSKADVDGLKGKQPCRHGLSLGAFFNRINPCSLCCTGNLM